MGSQICTRLFAICVGVAVVSGACSSSDDLGSGSASEGNTGQVVLALTNIPSDVHCLQVIVSGSQTVARFIDVTPGTSSVETLVGLPTGNVTFVENAYNEACSAVTATTALTWVSDPASAFLIPGVPVNVTIILRPAGQAIVTNDFQDGGLPPGTGGTGGSSGSGGSGGTGGVCVPIPFEEACGSRECGSVSNGCSGSYTCGGCSDPCAPICRSGFCVAITCLVAGTPIAMADGTSTPIEQVQVGQMVLAYDTATGVTRPQRVSKTFRHAAGENQDGMVLINGTVRATGNHPVYANGRFVRADELATGDSLVELSGDSPRATSIQAIEMSGEAVETFNLEVDADHDYFAGGVLVHNKPLPCF